MKRIVLVAICAGIFRCSAAEDLFSDIPVASCSGLPCVEVRLDGGQPARLLLDFASFTSYVSTSAVKSQRSGTTFQVQMGSVFLTDRFLAVDPRSEESLAQIGRSRMPGGDGGLSLRAFAQRLVILDLPHQRLRIWSGDESQARCPGGCGKLVLARQGDLVIVDIWAADGFSLNNRPVTALIDPLYPGGVLASRRIEGIITPEWRGKQLYIPGVATGTTYRTDRLLFVGSIFMTFGGRTVCNSTPLTRYEHMWGSPGDTYEVAIGRAVLSKLAIAFDFRNAAMWVADPNAKLLNCN